MKVVRLSCFTKDDLRQLAEIEAECFSVPLSGDQLSALLLSGNTLFLAAREGETTVGSVWAQTVLDEGYIGNVGVRREYRRRGVADILLDTLDRCAEELDLSFMTLEVRESNASAIALYEKHGYGRVGVRPAYYRGPKEDAVLMTKYY